MCPRSLARIGTIALCVGVHLLTSACARRTDVTFVVENAHAHVERLANTIGPRPVGTQANADARAYLIDQLRLYGFTVRTQDADAARPEAGVTVRVSNIIAFKPGRQTAAVALLAHYDSVSHAPGAADDALGTAVALEAARVLGARSAPAHSLAIILTDGEEAGLMGAAAAIEDAEVQSRIKAFLNIEAVGSSGPGVLFESGPGNDTLVRTWAAAAPHPRGASYAMEIYERLPNDTDFTIFRQLKIPGLNFAAVNDSYAYHTTRDTPERLSRATLRHTGETIVATVQALDARELRSGERDVRFSDVLGRHVIILSHAQGRLLAFVAVMAGIAAWIRMLRRMLAQGWLHALSTFVWGLLSLAAACGAMLAAAWLLQATREVHHPWYAHHWRLLALLVAWGVAAPWYLTRLASFLPARLSYLRAPESVWAMTLLVWCALCVWGEVTAPAAAHLWAIPLACAGLLLIVSVTWGPLARLASLAVLVVSAAIWLRDGIDLFGFMVTVMGRLPLVTPFWLYPAFVLAVGLMLAPPLVASFIGLVHGRRANTIVGAVLLTCASVTTALAWVADAYTPERPLRRMVRYVNDGPRASATWDVWSNEPGLDLALPATEAARWKPVPPGTSTASVPPLLGPSGAFQFTAPAEAAPAPALVSAKQRSAPGGLDYEVAVVPETRGLWATIVLPAGITPAQGVPAGFVARGRWRSTFGAIPPEGITFRLTLPAEAAARAGEIAVVVSSARVPGGGEERLPGWLPTERTDWAASAHWIVVPAASPASPDATPPAGPPAVPMRASR